MGKTINIMEMLILNPSSAQTREYISALERENGSSTVMLLNKKISDYLGAEITGDIEKLARPRPGTNDSHSFLTLVAGQNVEQVVEAIEGRCGGDVALVVAENICYAQAPYEIRRPAAQYIMNILNNGNADQLNQRRLVNAGQHATQPFNPLSRAFNHWHIKLNPVRDVLMDGAEANMGGWVNRPETKGEPAQEGNNGLF